MNRRDFLKMIGASTGVAVVTACDQPGPAKLISKLVPSDKNVLPGDALLVRTTCTECPAGCGIIAKVRDDHPVKLEGNPDHPLNHGALCMRGQASLSRLYHPGRIQSPLLKGANGEFQKISWDEAIAWVNSALARGGDRRHVFLSGRTTGAVSELVDAFCDKRTVERLPEYEVYSYAALRQANELVFGQPVLPTYNVTEADLLVTVGADVIETFLNPVQFARDLAKPNLHWTHIEPHLSLTGINADQRLAVRPGSEAWLLAHLADVLDVSAEKAATETGLKVTQITALAAAWKAAKKPLVIVGGVAVANEQGLLTAVLGAWLQATRNAPLDFNRVYDYDRVGTPADLAKLEARLRDSKVAGVFLHSTDPVAYNPGMTEALGKATFRVGLGDMFNATLLACDLILPLSHSLETWGEDESVTGVRSVIQPTLKPLHNTLSAGDTLLKLTGETISYQQYLAKRWASTQNELVAKGYQEVTGNRRTPSQNRDKVQAFLAGASLKPGLTGRTLVVAPSIRTYDGRSDVMPLLTEIPDPLTAISYGAWVTISEADAASLNVKDKEVIDFAVAGKNLQLPVRVMPSAPNGVLSLQQPFVKGLALPVDPQTGETLAVLPVGAVTAAAKTSPLAILSGSMHADGRGILPEHDHDHDHDHKDGHGEKHAAQATLYPEHEHKDYRWAMAIDLDRCTGCGACVAACYIENNIPVVGREEHIAGREMSWLRLEPFVTEAGDFEILPMMCQQCDHAPCETVCPVLATYHNPEGLNAQVYNRCVGTRYCANNCPYKVRRFNWVDHPAPKPLDLMFNPDVSKRPKGVMEKCTFCMHRITKAKDHAKDEKRLVRDGEMIPACAETCPAQAIVFGNMMDAGSRVHQQSESKRAYRVLEELGAQPSVYYLKSRSES